MLIAGGGVAGLSLGLMVPDALVCEADDTPGGLCRSEQLYGFTFDHGPHILGGIPDAVAWVVANTGIEFVPGTTRNVGFVNGKLVEHPFTDPQVGHNYMAKMWCRDPSELSTGGLGAQPGRKPGGVSTFLYPAHGGYQAITDALADRLGSRLQCGVTLDEADVWTGPVPGGCYNTLVTVTAGFEGTAPDLTAIYLPEPWTPFHRLSFPSAFAPGNAPPGCFSVQLEASFADESGFLLRGDADDVLDRLGFREPIFEHVEILRNAYPVPVEQPPTPAGHGRTGSLRYLNVDGVVAQSMERARYCEQVS